MVGLLVLCGVAMVIAAIIRPFRRASDTDRFADQAALHEADRHIDEIEGESR